MPERFVSVHSFWECWRDPVLDGVARAGYEIECSSGTYVRSLIADLGDAYCLELRRTAIGPFGSRTRSRCRSVRSCRSGAARSPAARLHKRTTQRAWRSR